MYSANRVAIAALKSIGSNPGPIENTWKIPFLNDVRTGRNHGEEVLQLEIPFEDPEAVLPTTTLLQLLTPDEIYAQPEKYLPLLREDRRIERKPGGIHSQPLGEYFSMWANTPPDGGLIVVGIEDKGDVTGLRTLDGKNLNTLEQTGYVRCPQAQYETKRVSMRNSEGEEDFVLLIRVHYHPCRVIETCDGKVFRRVAASTESQDVRVVRFD